MPLNFRYSPISREAREAGERLLELTRGYENLVVPRGLGVAPLAVLGIVARARALLRVAERLADSGDAAAAALPMRAITESVLTLGWFDKDPELAEAVWMLDELRTRLSHHKEVADEERRQRARARRRDESVPVLASGASLGLLTRAKVREYRRLEREQRQRVQRLPRLARRKERLRVTRISKMPSFADRAKVAGMPWVYSSAAVACHDIVVHVEHRLAGAACAEQGQVWEIGANGIPDTQNPISIGDDEVSSGGTGQFPGAVDFFHSVMFNNDGTVVNWVDESFGSGCPTRTTYNPRPWNPAGGVHKTGRMFFSDMEGNFLSEFHVGDVRPNPAAGEYCSAHMGMAVMGIERDLLVNAWYTGGADVIDFTQPTRLKEIAYSDPARNSGTWSAYPYTGPMFKTGPGIPVYASDGVTNNALAQGMVVYRTIIEKPGVPMRVDHLNPQTMDHE